MFVYIFFQLIATRKFVTLCFHLQVDSGAEVLASVDGLAAKLLLDTEDLVELGETLGTSRSTSLDLAGAETDDDVGNGDILSLTRAVGDHDAPAGTEGVLGSLDSLGDGTDLVDLQEKGCLLYTSDAADDN